MRRSLRKLIDEFPPPENPKETTGDWDEIELKIGLIFPDDYKEFINTYGLVYINRFMYVFNPFTKSVYSNLCETFLVRLRAEWDPTTKFPDLNDSYSFYPAKDGVFRWGMNDGGDEFYWRTKGKPNQWDVVIFDRGSCVWKLIEGQSFSDVLYAMLTDTLEEFWLQNDTPEGEPRCVPFD